MPNSNQPTDFSNWIKNIPALPPGKEVELNVTLKLPKELFLRLAMGAACNGMSIEEAVHYLLVDHNDTGAVCQWTDVDWQIAKAEEQETRARQYGIALIRYLTEDPIEGAPSGRPFSLHRSIPRD